MIDSIRSKNNVLVKVSSQNENTFQLQLIEFHKKL